MTVVFTRAIDPDTIDAETFGIAGVAGQIEKNADNLTFSVVPDAPLACDSEYTGFVTTGVKSKAAHKALRPSLIGDGGVVSADKDSWTFRTCGCD